MEEVSAPGAASLEGVYAAAQRIKPFAHVTPVMTCSTANAAAGRQLFFKCENFQRTGAFKFRGACNSVMLLSEEQAAKGASHCRQVLTVLAAHLK